MGTQREVKKGNFGNCDPQMTEEMKFSLCKGGFNPPASLPIAPGMLQMLSEPGRDEFKWQHRSLKALFNPNLHMALPGGGSHGGVASPPPSVPHRVREGGNTAPLREEKAL